MVLDTSALGPGINAVEMVRRIREAHYATIKDLSPDEKIRFFREKARALHTDLGSPEDKLVLGASRKDFAA